MRRSRTANANDNNLFALLANAIDQRNKIAVASAKDELPDIRVGVQRLHRIDTQVHVDAIFDRPACAAHIAIVVVRRHVHRLDTICIQRT